MALALPLLERIAPDVEPPLAYRVGAEPPRIVDGDPPLAAAYDEAARLSGRRGPAGADRARLAARRPGGGAGSLFDESRIAVLTPREAKGMEFDHVIVVEPALIVEEAVEGQGLRELYVALTRPTRTLVLVHSRPLPRELEELKPPGELLVTRRSGHDEGQPSRLSMRTLSPTSAPSSQRAS